MANCLNAVVARGLSDGLMPCSWIVRRVKAEYLVPVPGFKPKTFRRELQYSATSADLCSSSLLRQDVVKPCDCASAMCHQTVEFAFLLSLNQRVGNN